jgi:hypothetical protein
VGDGYDFAYGCIFEDDQIFFECGVGPGTDCEDCGDNYCEDTEFIAECLYGKITSQSCLTFCQETGIDGVTYEHGECDDAGGTEAAVCFCCDFGTEGCPEG